MPESTPESCELCQRDNLPLTRHHLIPQTRHKNRRNKREFSRSEVRSRLAMLCEPCHANVHVHFTNKELERRLNTVEALRQEPVIQKFSRWIGRKPAGFKPASRPIHYR